MFRSDGVRRFQKTTLYRSLTKLLIAIMIASLVLPVGAATLRPPPHKAPV